MEKILPIIPGNCGKSQITMKGLKVLSYYEKLFDSIESGEK